MIKLKFTLEGFRTLKTYNFVGSRPENESAWKERSQINIIVMTPISLWTWTWGFGQHADCLKKALCPWAREKSRAWGEKIIQKEEG